MTPARLLVAPADRLAPVVVRLRRLGWDEEIRATASPEWPPDPIWLARAVRGAAAAIVVGERVPPRRLVGGTHVMDTDGRPVPVGIAVDTQAAWQTIVEVERRTTTGLGPGPVALLGSRDERAVELASSVERRLSAPHGPTIRRLTADRLGRFALAEAIGSGTGVALYVGQASRAGWSGYGGVRPEHLAGDSWQPLGAVCSVTCYGAAATRSTASFAELLVGSGMAAGVMGAIGLVRHEADVALAEAIAERIAAGARTLAETLPPDNPTLRSYRIIGDPLASLIGARGSRRAIQAVLAPAPGARLPPVEWRSMVG